MKKIICIGECSLNIVLGTDGTPLGSMPGGRIANAAAILARDRFNVLMASEASSDPVGDIVVKHLTDAGVDVNAVDRFTEGRTPVNIFVSDGQENSEAPLTRYEQYPDDCFDIIWPRIDEGDIIIFGGYYALDKRMHPRLMRLLNHAVERKAVLIYLPGFLPQQEPRITRIMPEILENLEIANIVVVRSNDLRLIFGADDSDTCYHKHIDFYCRSLIAIEGACRRISYYSGSSVTSVGIPERTCEGLLWNAGAVAGIAAAVFDSNLGIDDFENPSEETRRTLLSQAATCANAVAGSLRQAWQHIH